ncbi:MAG: glucose-6-phosphate dehydrogenase [Lysobacterales bacterium]
MAEFVPVDPFDLVIFGGTGDLAQRKLLPALYHRDKDAQFTDDSRIVAVSRSQIDQQQFVTLVREALEAHLSEGDLDEAVWARFASRLHHSQLDIMAAEGWANFSETLDASGQRIRVFYLATAPNLFTAIAARLGEFGLKDDRSRIVLEKPVGTDLATAQQINDGVGDVFAEPNVYRIDHYLGKETVQNLAALRFANSLFEPLWQRTCVDHIQITVAESLGVGNRAGFYDGTGALRDMVQNHMLQLLCLVAMEPPISMHHDDLRNEKLRVLRSLRPIDASNVSQVTVRGQYGAGAISGEAVPGYLQELGSDGENSVTETFVAIKAEVDNWRWSGTPIYLRTGKRLAHKFSEIVLQFRPVAHSIFPQASGALEANRLIIRLQPDEGVTLSLVTKQPGPGGFQLRSLPLNLSFSEAYSARYPDAYERLLMEVLRGNPALFMRRDEVEAAWTWVDAIRAGWQESGTRVSPYVAGTWGPSDASLLLDRDGRSWREPDAR